MTHAPIIKIDGDIIPVTPHPEHEFTLPTKHVAERYGISDATLRRHKSEHADELIEGKHFISVQNLNANPRGGIPHISTHWTKRGVIRLGFFIRSERARRFRDLAEDLVLRSIDVQAEASQPLDIRDLPRLMLDKFRGFQVGRDGSLADLERLAQLCLDTARRVDPAAGLEVQPPAPESVPGPAGPDPLANWVAWLANELYATGTPRAAYTLTDLVAMCPPLPGHPRDRRKALGRRLAQLSDRPIPYGPGQRCRLYSQRDARHRLWVVDIALPQ